MINNNNKKLSIELLHFVCVDLTVFGSTVHSSVCIFVLNSNLLSRDGILRKTHFIYIYNEKFVVANFTQTLMRGTLQK